MGRIIIGWVIFNVLAGFFASLFYGTDFTGIDYGEGLDGFLAVLSFMVNLIPSILFAFVGAFPDWPLALSAIWTTINSLVLVVGIAEVITG